MTTTNNVFCAGAAERLMKSADSLDFALQGANNNKKSSSAPARQGFLDFGGLDSLFAGTGDLSATLFDDWLSNDLQQVGFVGQDEPLSSSSSDSDPSDSPRLQSPSTSSSEAGSPNLGFDSLASTELIQSSGLDASMALFPEIQQQQQQQQQQPQPQQTSSAFGLASASPMLPLTPDAIQQAAAALNIPWSKSLETAVLAQSLLASIPMALQMPLRPTVASTPVVSAATATAAAVAPVSPLLCQAMPAATPATTQATSTPASPVAASVSAPLSPFLAMERAPSASPSIAPSTPRTSLSILSSTQTSVPGTNSAKATIYKSAYRSTSLPRGGLKRDRSSSVCDEPPSVLEGRDVTDMDEVALKRAKNTDAARRSRHKKLVRMEGLEQRVAELEVENSMFETKLNEVELERSLLADKDQLQQARIQELEKMLSTMREKLIQ